MSGETKHTQSEVEARIAGLDEETQKRMVCALVGHSRIHETCFGYHYCARCGEQVGDTLASLYPEAKEAVVVGHNCETCQANFAECDWRDTFMAPDPFSTQPNADASSAAGADQ